MPKLIPTREPPRGFVAVRCPFSPTFAKELRALPGVTLGHRLSDPEESDYWSGYLMIPEELRTKVEALAKRRRVKLSNWRQTSAAKTLQLPPPFPPSGLSLFPYQQEGAQRIIQQRSILLNYEPGLGKTPTTIAALRALDHRAPVGDTLIVCPANVRRTWKDELSKWGWRGDVALIEEGADWEILHKTNLASHAEADEVRRSRITVTSYELLVRAVEAGLSAGLSMPLYNVVVLDEAHKIKNTKSSFNASVKAIAATVPHAWRVALTATPVANNPEDLYPVLDWLFPERFGSYWDFVLRYCNTKKNAYGSEIVYELLSDGTWSSLNKSTEAELVARLQAVAHRVTKEAVAHVLPAYTVQAVRYRTTSGELRRIREQACGAVGQHKELADRGLLLASAEKVQRALDLAHDALEGGETHVVILTWLKATAKEVFKALAGSESFETFYIDGDVSTPRRDEILAVCRRAPRAVAVVTMASVLEGVNSLTQFSTAIYAEMYYSPRVMIQSLGRFSRLNSVAPSRALLVIFEGTLDEDVALSVLKKTQSANRLFAAGQLDSALSTSLGETESDEDFFAGLRAAALAGGSESVY